MESSKFFNPAPAPLGGSFLATNGSVSGGDCRATPHAECFGWAAFSFASGGSAIRRKDACTSGTVDADKALSPTKVSRRQ